MSAVFKLFSNAHTVLEKKLWLDRYMQLRQIIKDNRFLEEFVRNEFRIEMSLGLAFDRYRQFGKPPSLRQRPDLFEAYSFLYMLLQVHSTLNEKGGKVLRTRVSGGLNKGQSVGSIAFELSTAAHFLSNGFYIYFKDMQEDGGADILARKGEFTIEVECKHVSGEIGDPVHRRKFIEFIHSQLPKIEKHLGRVLHSIVILVTIPERLRNRDGLYEKLGDLMCQAIREQQRVQDDLGNEAIINFCPMPLELTRENATAFAARTLEQVYGARNVHGIFSHKAGQPAIVIGMISKQRMRVVERIFDQLRDSAERQLSGRFPSALCVYLSAVSTQQMNSIAREANGRTALEIAVQDFFQRRPHVSTLMFVSSNRPLWATDLAGGAATGFRSQQQALLFHNGNCSQPLAPNIELFPRTPWHRIR